MYKIYQAEFDYDCTVPIPAGHHEISLELTAGDWIGIGSYKLTNYRSSRYANVAITGIQRGNRALIWVQNKDYNWQNVYLKTPIPAVTGATATVHGFAAGRYRVQTIDTTTGEFGTGHDIRVDRTGTVTLLLPDFTRDLAYNIQPS
jgi:hypothetical protein